MNQKERKKVAYKGKEKRNCEEENVGILSRL